jgi:hypothetical protein
LSDSNSKTFLPLQIKSNVKYLGLFIDSNLTWKAHIDYISLKISRAVGIIARLRHFVPKHTLQRIYYALLHPYLNYGISVWGQPCKTHLHHLLVFQKRAIQLMNFAVLLFSASRILPVNFLYFYNVACNMHDIINEGCPSTCHHFSLLLSLCFATGCEIIPSDTSCV